MDWNLFFMIVGVAAVAAVPMKILARLEGEHHEKA